MTAVSSERRPPAVVLERVRKHYGRGDGAVAAVAGISLTVRSGEFVSVMGPSGCGKSTLLNLVAGLDQPDAGRVVVAGNDLARLSDDARSALRLTAIGFIFQSFNLFPTFTVEENVAWPLEFLGVRWREARDRAHRVLARMQIGAGAYRRRPAELSGGEQQRVAIARALVTDANLLLADEPTGNLDTRTGRHTLELLRALNTDRGVTVVLVTHDPVAATYAQRTVELRDGRIVGEIG